MAHSGVIGAAEWQQQSEKLLLDAQLQPSGGSAEIGVFQDWILELQTASGRPLQQANIAVGGGMRDHGHGLPTQPMVTEYLGQGRYLIEGLKLNMAGRWMLAFAVEAPDLNDRLIFDIDLTQWTENERRLLESMYLDPETPPPPAPSNNVADNDEAAQLGEKLFFDSRLSANGEISCASCHQPNQYFIDGLPLGVGIKQGSRNTPTIIGAAYLSWFYWDGRRDSLWSQALIPFEAADEMGSSRTTIARLISTDSDYRKRYERVFGKMPPSLDFSELPEHAGPLGAAPARDAWHRISRKDMKLINTIYANIGKAIAAYERNLPVPVSRFDRFVAALSDDNDGAEELLSVDELAGLRLFMNSERTHCLRCHNGPWFTNNGFHNIGTGNLSGKHLDFGRVFGLRSVLMDEFNCLGPYSDALPDQCKEMRFLNRSSHVPLEGAFKVPGLRNLAATAPYMHDGRFDDLESVLAFYREPPGEGATHELPELTLTDAEARQIVAFLNTLSMEN